MTAGNSFPKFELKNQKGELVTLDSLSGRKALIYFYPKDDTPGCTVEACNFRDSMPDLGDVLVLGVSPDAEKSHIKFINKFQLNFDLLADVDKTLCESLGIWVEKSMYGKKYMGVARTTYLVDEKGVILKIWENVKPEGHAEEVKAFLNSL